MDGGVEDKGNCRRVKSSLVVSNDGGDGARRGVGLSEENEDDGLLFFSDSYRIGTESWVGFGAGLGWSWAAPWASDGGLLRPGEASFLFSILFSIFNFQFSVFFFYIFYLFPNQLLFWILV
jgi:hypothetical protein